MHEILGRESYLTSYQVARHFGICRMTVTRAVASGHLVAAMRLPGRNGAFLFTAEAVNAWRQRPVPLVDLDDVEAVA